ncbi:MAG: tRNA uridine(34) 5-carboxymethylaminomethyl modification radical SAM/GNAT enzyme Elp3 [Candidatus Syntropharchaeia archaeon]
MMDGYRSACEEIAREVRKNGTKDLERIKRRVSTKHGLKNLPRNADILAYLDENFDFLRKKPVRTISGVAVVSVMTSPHPCPHGKCMMCPGGPDSEFLSPQSYTGKEPATLRAIQQKFDPYDQVRVRIAQLREIGHKVSKVELIVMGGTIAARPLFYQEWFVKRCLDAMNERNSGGLEEAQMINERARMRNVGITFETRPDYVNLNDMLRMGVTKVELGVQHTDDSILKRIERGHTVDDVILANRTLRDGAIKVGFHMMPGLPGSDFERDLEMFEEIFQNEDFKPDYLKIYPTLVVRGTKLYDLWKRGKYKPLLDEEAAELIARVKERIPRWIRLQRVQRDIPASQIEAGVKKSNLRQLARGKMRKKCECIRCREVGHAIFRGIKPERIDLYVEKYDACGGTEYFISYEDLKRDILIGFIRLRFPHSPKRKELKNSALIRDLHVYGEAVDVGEKPDKMEWQHRGYGRLLLEKAEEISSIEGFEKIAVMSGVGVRGYYRKFGYRKEGPFMSKKI